MGISSLGIGCSSKNSSSTSSKNSNELSTSNDNSLSEDLSNNEKIDGDFIWEDGKYIAGLSEEGQKKENIIIPANCEGILLSIVALANGFNSNYNIKSISFESEEITELPNSFLLNDSNLESIELPKKLESIPNNFAANCSSIKNIEIPDTVKEIGKKAFSNTSIEEMKIPEGVTTVEEAIFMFTPIKKLYLPESLNKIDNNFLRDIDNLDENGKKLYDLEVYVKEGSYADQHFSDYSNSSTIKKYY